MPEITFETFDHHATVLFKLRSVNLIRRILEFSIIEMEYI